MKPSAKRLIGVLASLLLIISTLVFYTSLLIPKYLDVQELRGEREALLTLLAEEQEAVGAVNRLISQYGNLVTLRESLSVVLPSDEEVSSIVNQFQGIASSNGILMTSLSIRPLAVEQRVGDEIIKPTGALRISMNLIGGYDSIKAYLRALETNIRIMDVRSLRISGGATQGPYNYQIEVDTYHQI